MRTVIILVVLCSIIVASDNEQFNVDAGCARGAGFSLAFRFSAVRGAGVSNQSESFTLWNTLTCSDYEQTDYIFPFAADAHFYCSGQNTSNLSGIQYSEAQVDILQSLAEDGYVYDLRLKTDDTEVGISHIPVAFRMEGQYYLVNHIDFVIQYRERKNGSHEVFGFEGIGRSYGYERENFGVDGCELRGSGYPEEQLDIRSLREDSAFFTYTTTFVAENKSLENSSKIIHSHLIIGNDEESSEELDSQLPTVRPLHFLDILPSFVIIGITFGLALRKSKQMRKTEEKKKMSFGEMSELGQSQSLNSSNNIGIKNNKNGDNDTDQLLDTIQMSQGDKMLIREKRWQSIAQDVFRSPHNPKVLGIFVGVGIQICWAIIVVVTPLRIFIFSGDVNQRGNVLLILSITISCFSFIGGILATYIQKLFQKENEEEEQGQQITQRQQINISSAISCTTSLPMYIVIICISFIRILAGTGTSPSFLSIHLYILFYIGSSFIFSLFGLLYQSKKIYYVGQVEQSSQKGLLSLFFTIPSNAKIGNIPRLIGERPWYSIFPISYISTGLIPSLPIMIVLHALSRGWIAQSVWDIILETLSGIILPLIGAASVSILFIGIQLESEDHQWIWRSFHYAASGSIIVLIDSLALAFEGGSAGLGVLSGTEFVIITAGVSFAAYLCLGSVGFISTLSFIRKLYSSLHTQINI